MYEDGVSGKNIRGEFSCNVSCTGKTLKTKAFVIKIKKNRKKVELIERGLDGTVPFMSVCCSSSKTSMVNES